MVKMHAEKKKIRCIFSSEIYPNRWNTLYRNATWEHLPHTNCVCFFVIVVVDKVRIGEASPNISNRLHIYIHTPKIWENVTATAAAGDGCPFFFPPAFRLLSVKSLHCKYCIDVCGTTRTMNTKLSIHTLCSYIKSHFLCLSVAIFSFSSLVAIQANPIYSHILILWQMFVTQTLTHTRKKKKDKFMHMLYWK